MGKWLFLLIFLVIGAWLVGREVISIGAERRAGRDARRLHPRFWRRFKGVGLLLLLYVLAAFFETFARAGAFTVREGILYLGGFLIALFWLLILAARDIRATAEDALAERQAFTLESLAAMEQEIRQGKAPRQPADKPAEAGSQRREAPETLPIRSAGRQKRALRRKRRR